MTLLTIRKSGGANIVSIPRAVLKTLGLHTNSQVELSLENNKIILTPINKTLTLDEVLAGSPKKHLNLNKEDQTWLDDDMIGKEEI